MTDKALKVYQLSVNYDTTPVLWDITFEIPSGQLVAIVGPNGAGKSTLIKTALDLVHPISGKVEFFGKSLKEMRRRIAYVPQRESVDWDFPITVHDLVIMGRYGRLGFLRWPRRADHCAADHYLDLVGMLEFRDRQISELSGGQQQRAFIARALIQEADIYFMDEPLTGIDHVSEGLIMALLQRLKKKGKTVFIVHHDLSSVHSYFDWVLLLNTSLVAYGDVASTFTSENLHRTYGKSYTLLEEALRLSNYQHSGLN